MSTSNSIVVIYCEGETEIEFYDRLLSELKKIYNMRKFSCKVIKNCLHGITKFDKKLINKFRNEIASTYKKYDIYVFLCYDTDVFEINAKPPINWNKVEKELLNSGAKNIYHIKAKRCIEDIFLNDLEGICKFLNINIKKSVPGSNGVDKMKYLFSCGNRIYQKGFSCEGFINSLDMPKILKKMGNTIKPLVEKTCSHENIKKIK